MFCYLPASVLAPGRPGYIYFSLDFMVEWICHRFAESMEGKVTGIKYLPGARRLLGFSLCYRLYSIQQASQVATYPPPSSITGEERDAAG